MFYSHEILTSRKYGVATVWLVATLGAKSSTKKVTRKAILDVNVKKACETIMEPEAPMALRLQSNLLYGVSRVHFQQWEYLLTDAQTAQNNIRAILRDARLGDKQIDVEVGKTRPDQLVLMDDPAFAPDAALPAFDLALFELQNDPTGDMQRSSQSMLSIRHRSSSVASFLAPSVMGLNIPSSSHGGAGSYQLPAYDQFGGSSASKAFGRMAEDEEPLIYEEDDLFNFDADGNIRDIPEEERSAIRAANVLKSGRPGLDSDAAGRVRNDHEVALATRIFPSMDKDGHFNMQYGDDDFQVLPDADPFPMMVGGLGAGDQPQNLNDQDRVISEEEPSSMEVAAPLIAGKKRTKTKKTLKIDLNTQLPGSELRGWQDQYLTMMTANTVTRINHRAVVAAKKNALHFLYGAGLNGVGIGIGSAKLPSPLSLFSGEALLSALTNREPASPLPKKGTKRPAASDPSEASSPKRARDSELGRAHGDDDFLINMVDEVQPHIQNGEHEESMEMGRDAPSALPDYPSSAMPWNIASSAHSHSIQQQSSLRPGSFNRHLTSASPLIGRGVADLGPGGQSWGQLMGEDDAMVMYGRSDNDSPSHSKAAGLGSVRGMNSSQANGPEEFELFGAAAGVDTQTAGSSQWVREALDRESNNFFMFLQNSIKEKYAKGHGEADDGELEGEGELDELSGVALGGKTVVFEELFVPERNSAMVAAQAFYHVLSLATKRKVWVEQDGQGEEVGAEIRIGVLA